MSPPDPDYESPGDDIGLDGALPFDSSGVTTPDLTPRWLWVFVGDGGLSGYQIWVVFFADEAPPDLPCLEAQIPELPALGLHVIHPDGRRVRVLPRRTGYAAKQRSSGGGSGRNRPVPPDMPVYVDAYLVMATMGCKRSQAYAEIRKAGGRDGRVRLEFWKRYRDIEDGLTNKYGDTT